MSQRSTSLRRPPRRARIDHEPSACPHCAKSERSHGAAADFGLLPPSRPAKAEAAFDDADAGRDAGSGGDGSSAAPAVATLDAGSGAVPAQATGPTPAAPTPAPAAAAAPPVPAITWPASNSSTNNGNGASTTRGAPFVPVYTATQDATANVWRMGITSVTGGADIVVRTGGSRDPGLRPPTTQAQAKDAVDVMKAYYTRGSRGSWHTEGASQTHEEHHYREWRCSADHYWAIAGPAIAALTVPLASHANAAAATAAMKSSADSKMTSFRTAARTYWMSLSDSGGSRPFAAGQAILNIAITAVQALAASKGWTVPGGTTATSGTEPPCYQPYPPYTP